MSENAYDDGRRETIKIIGAIGIQCAFPFAGDELYGQHQHPAPGKSADPGPPKFFNAEQFSILSRVTDLIVPGAIKAQVPNYIDLVVRNNEIHKKTYTDGLSWLPLRNFSPWMKSNNCRFLSRSALKWIEASGPLWSRSFFV